MVKTAAMEKIINGSLYTYDQQFDIISLKNFEPCYFPLKRTVDNTIVDLCVEITTKCNRTCLNCFSKSNASEVYTELPYEDFDFFLKKNEQKYIRVSLTGGEPLLHHNIHNYLKLPTIFNKIGFVLSTNGSVAKRYYEEISKTQWTIALSLHGNEDAHTRYVGKNDFSNVLESLTRLSNSNFVHIYCVLHEFLTKQDIDWLYELRDSSKVSFLRFIKPRNFGRYASVTTNSLIEYVIKRIDDRSAYKIDASPTHFLTSNGKLRMSN